MPPSIRRFLLAGALGVLALPAAAAQAAPVQPLTLTRIGGTTPAGTAAAEISAYDARSEQLFTTNRFDADPAAPPAALNQLDVFDLSKPGTPDFGKRVKTIELGAYGAGANSVAVRPEGTPLIAVAMEADPKTSDGTIAVFKTDGTYLRSFPAGALPDMVTFTKDGCRILSANEGEPSGYGQPGSIDPKGSVTVVDLPCRGRGHDRHGWHRGRDHGHRGHRAGASHHRGGGDPLKGATATTITFTGFSDAALRSAGVRIYGPGATAETDLEPEYIATDPEGRTAWVTLQENNALAVLDLRKKKVTAIKPLGFKDLSKAENELDPSDRDSRTIATRPPDLPTTYANLYGMYQPDAVAAYTLGRRGKLRLVTANEGDARDWPGLAEEARVSSLTLDPTAFPTAATIKQNPQLGRLNVTNQLGKNAAGAFDRLYAFGGRSLSIWDAAGAQKFDTGADLEKLVVDAVVQTAIGPQAGPAFNADLSVGTLPATWNTDQRSDNKGPEPEGVAVGKVAGREYAFLGLERSGGVVAYDLAAAPDQALRAGYVNSTAVGAAGPPAVPVSDVSPEGVLSIPARQSPTGKALVVATFEVSGNVAIYEVTPAPAP